MELMVGASAPSGNGPEAGYGGQCAPSALLGPPRPIEAEVAVIWADVLGLDTVEPDENFFELGGDSLSAALILSRVSRHFHCRLVESDLFAARTVRGLCAALKRATPAHSIEPTIAPLAGPRVRFPATAAQRRLWILDHIIPNPEVYNVRYLVRVEGTLVTDALRVAFEQLENRQEALRVHFETEDGLPVQVVGRRGGSNCHSSTCPTNPSPRRGKSSGKK